MTRHVVPAYGPHAGRLCVRDNSGALAPCPDVDSASAPPAVVVPAAFGYDLAHSRGTVDLMTGQLVKAGHSVKDARAIAVVAQQRTSDDDRPCERPYPSLRST